MKIADLTYDEMQLVHEGACEACKGSQWYQDTGCYEKCEVFQQELDEAVAEGALPLKGDKR